MPIRLEPWQDDESEESPPAPIDPARLTDPFAALPPAIEFTSDHQAWLNVDLSQGACGQDLIARTRAVAIRGPTPQEHAQRRERFAELRAEVERRGFLLPPEFITLMESDEYVRRLRLGCHLVELGEFLCPFPGAEDHILFLFLCEWEGCAYTHLLLRPDGSHCVTRTGHWYGQHPNPPGARSSRHAMKIFHLADSFAEFLVRESDAACESERKRAQWDVSFGDRFRSSGDLAGALLLYKMAFAYDPASPVIRARIAELSSAQ